MRCIASGQLGEQLLHRIVVAKPLQISHQNEGATGLIKTPAQALTAGQGEHQTHRLATDRGADDAIPVGLVTKRHKAFGQKLFVAQDGGQDGEMGHAAMLSGFDPSRGPLRVGVLASGSGSNFEALVQHCRDQPELEIVLLIVNRPGCGAIERAARLQVPSQLIDHTLYPSRESLDQAVVEQLQAAGIELVVMAGWMRIVTSRLIQAFPQRLLNIHPSLLPAFRGMHAIRQALEAGVSETGCTVHEVVEDVDAGPVLGQARVPVLESDDETSLAQRIHAAEHELLPRMVIQRARELLAQG